MPGPRFIDWAHRRVVGEPGAADPYWPFARKLLGFVAEEAERQQLGVHTLRRELPDGAVVIAEKIGEQHRMTVIPPRPVGGKERMFKTRAIVIAATHIVGVDLEQYVVIDDAIVRVKQLHEVVWTVPYGDDLIDMSAGPDGSFYKPPDRHASGFFVIDFGSNTLGHLSVDDGSVLLQRTFPYGGTTNLLDTATANPNGNEVYSYGVLSSALNAMRAEALEVRASTTGAFGGIRGDVAGVMLDGKTIYACEQPSPGLTYVTIVRTEDLAVLGTINMTAAFGPGIGIQGFFPGHDGKTMYALGWISELYSPLPGYTDIASILILIDTETMTIRTSRVYPHRGFYTAMGKCSRDGKRIYVAEILTAGSSGRCFVIDGETLDPIRGAPVDTYRPAYFPAGIGLSTDEKRYYVAGRTGPDEFDSQLCIAVCDSEADVLETRIELGVFGFCWGMALVTMPMSPE